jgi:flagellar basal-body rod modification protein FlgD
MQASAMTGKQVTVTSNQVPLQNGQGTIQFTTPSAEPVDIAIYGSNGNKLSDNMMMSTSGTNTWNWNGTNSSGATEPDGSYQVVVTAAGSGGTTTTLPTNMIGTATGVQSLSTGMQLELGALSVPFSSVVSVGN